MDWNASAHNKTAYLLEGRVVSIHEYDIVHVNYLTLQEASLRESYSRF